MLALCAAPVAAQAPELAAERLAPGESVRVDGRLDEPAWARAGIADGFTQIEPTPGAPASERTEVRVLYGGGALLVGVKAYVSDPETVVRRLARRDEMPVSDLVYVEVGSPADGRTAFSFGLNASGVRSDAVLTDDTSEGDLSWDAVWTSSVSRFQDADGAGGWSAEIRVPFSQLRYDADGAAPWQIQFQRNIPATGERVYWAPLLDEDAYVSRFGTLTGLRGLRAPRRVELVPYAAGRVTRAPGDDADPFYDATALAPSVGLDARVGLTSGLTLTATANPDFGQVEQDPAVLNLSQFEDRFGERRPFFVEGADVFRFGGTRGQRATERPEFFYSRRIGADPLPFRALYRDTSAAFTEVPERTTIATAAKVSGQVGGWTVGLLDAVTVEEQARFITADGARRELPVAPLTNSLVARAERAWNGGRSTAGGFASSVLRDGADGAFAARLADAATVAGVDGEHAFAGRRWTVSGVLAGSYLAGNRAVIGRLQSSSARYYGRPDQGYLTLDPDATTLAGYRAEAALARTGGDPHWRGSLVLGATSPGFEANDLGFQRRADYLSADWNVDYIVRDPGASFLNYVNVYGFGSQALNYGGDHINHRYNAAVFARFANLWWTQVIASYRPVYVNDRLTRGGPLALRPSDAALSVRVQTNPGRRVSGGLRVAARHDLPHSHQSVGDEASFVLQPSVAWRPSAALRLDLAPGLTLARNTDQYLGTVSDAASVFGTRYLFSDTDIEQLAVELRADWTFTPRLSVQLYAEPSVFSVRYSDFRQLSARRTYDFDRFGVEPRVADGDTDRPAAEGETPTQYTLTPTDGGAPFTLGNFDFTQLALRGNAVLRWEWRPGSTFFLVWQQTRDDFDVYDGDTIGGLGDAFSAEGQNVFLAKLTYWFGL